MRRKRAACSGQATPQCGRCGVRFRRRWGAVPPDQRPPRLSLPRPLRPQLAKPLLNLFAGVPRARTWRAAVDAALQREGRRSGSLQSISQLLAQTLGVLPLEALDAPPAATADAAPLELREAPESDRRSALQA